MYFTNNLGPSRTLVTPVLTYKSQHAREREREKSCACPGEFIALASGVHAPDSATNLRASYDSLSRVCMYNTTAGD